MSAPSVRGTTRAIALSDGDVARAVVVATGIGWAILFVAIGLRYELQAYADGSLFSYAVAAQEPWAFHWHNISGRVFVYLFSFVPAETYVGLTGDAAGGIAVYGFLFYVAPLLGLVATFAADRSQGRVLFSYACASTACLCPLVFGFPTEMWMAHALFWPTLAVCHYAGGARRGLALVFAALIALVLAHEAALVLALAILGTLLPRGLRDAALARAAGAFLTAIAVWIAVKATWPPDDYFAPVYARAEWHFFDLSTFTGDLVLLLAAALVGYAAILFVLRAWTPARAHLLAAAMVAAALAVYWLRFDHALHADNRYYLRTVLLIGTLIFAALAALSALGAEGRPKLEIPCLPRLVAALAADTTARAVTGAVLLVTLVHAVETKKFVVAWADYRAAVRALATGSASDPALGDARFVSSERIGADLNRLSWTSTTLYLSVLVAPDFSPARLVIDPASNYFWLSCASATKNLEADRAVPVETRRLLRAYACQHR